MKDYNYDIFRYYGKYKENIKERLNRPFSLNYIILFRKYNATNCNLKKIYYKIRLRNSSKKSFIQIPHSVKIGNGFYIGHEGRVIINLNVKIGNNCNIATGVVIGQENRGIRRGTPIIGNNVWIGANSVLVGNIKIGNDVLIAPLSYINFDVPDHSIVLGNPAKIIYKENATENYINRIIK